MNSPARYEDQHFKNQRILIDGVVFINCKFEKCELEYLGGALPQISGCTFASPQFIFSSAAGNTLQLLSGLYKGGFTMFVETVIDDIRKGEFTR